MWFLLLSFLVFSTSVVAQVSDQEVDEAFQMCRQHRQASSYAAEWGQCNAVRDEWQARHATSSMPPNTFVAPFRFIDPEHVMLDHLLERLQK